MYEYVLFVDYHLEVDTYVPTTFHAYEVAEKVNIYKILTLINIKVNNS